MPPPIGISSALAFEAAGRDHQLRPQSVHLPKSRPNGGATTSYSAFLAAATGSANSPVRVRDIGDSDASDDEVGGWQHAGAATIPVHAIREGYGGNEQPRGSASPSRQPRPHCSHAEPLADDGAHAAEAKRVRRAWVVAQEALIANIDADRAPNGNADRLGVRIPARPTAEPLHAAPREAVAVGMSVQHQEDLSEAASSPAVGAQPVPAAAPPQPAALFAAAGLSGALDHGVEDLLGMLGKQAEADGVVLEGDAEVDAVEYAINYTPAEDVWLTTEPGHAEPEYASNYEGSSHTPAEPPPAEPPHAPLPREPPEQPGQAARVVFGSMHCDDDESSSDAESDSQGPEAGACETPLSKASIARALRPANSGFDFDDDDDEVVFG